MFEAAILANPSHAESLGNLAVLLHGQASIEETVLRRIEALYKRAVHADPTNANNFSNYGLFLAEVTLALSTFFRNVRHSSNHIKVKKVCPSQFALAMQEMASSRMLVSNF